MSAWLAGFFATLAEKLIELLGHDIMDLVAKRRAQKAAEDEAQRSVQKLKDAKTGKEIDDASDSTLNGV